MPQCYQETYLKEVESDIADMGTLTWDMALHNLEPNTLSLTFRSSIVERIHSVPSYDLQNLIGDGKGYC